MNYRGVTSRMFLSLAVAVILLVLITPAIGVDHPVEPFKKAKSMAYTEGDEFGIKPYGKKFVLAIKEWGEITYTTPDGSIVLMKGSPDNYVGVEYCGKTAKYHVTRRMKGGKSEIMDVDWWVAMDIADKYLQEIEAVRDK